MNNVTHKRKNFILFFLIFFLFTIASNSQTWVRKLEGFSLWGLEKDYQGNLWAGTTGSLRGIFKSTDGGDTWTNMYPASSTNHVDIAADSLGNIFVTAGSSGLLKSTDGGLTFTLIPGSNFGNKTLNAVACGRAGFVYAGATTGGVFVSTDTGSTFTSTALQTYSIVSLAVDKFNSNIVYAGASSTSLNGFFKSTDGGFTFGASTNPVNVWSIIEDNAGTLYTASTSSTYPFCRSTDGGDTWDTLANIPAAMRGGTIDIAGNLYTSGNGGVYRSTDGGHNFSHLGHSVASNQIVNWNDRILVASTGSSTGGVYIFHDPSLPVELASFTASIINNSVELRWSTSSEKNNLGFEVQRIAQSDQWETLGFISGKGTSTQLNQYSFTDNFDALIHNHSLTLNPKFIYRLKQIDFDGSFSFSNEIEIDVNVPAGFSLEQNYPNPFNPSTIISYQLSASSNVSLKIFDVLGNEVATLIDNEWKEAGYYNYQLSIDKYQLQSGVYFYQLRAGNFSQTRKMILMR